MISLDLFFGQSSHDTVFHNMTQFLVFAVNDVFENDTVSVAISITVSYVVNDPVLFHQDIIFVVYSLRIFFRIFGNDIVAVKFIVQVQFLPTLLVTIEVI